MSDIMPAQFKADNTKIPKNGKISWGQLNITGLPELTTLSTFISKRETLAHHELTAEKELLCKFFFL